MALMLASQQGLIALRCLQEVHLDKHIKLLDCPGIVMATSTSDAAMILRNCVKIEQLVDPLPPVEAILRRCNKAQVCEVKCEGKCLKRSKYILHSDFFFFCRADYGTLQSSGLSHCPGVLVASCKAPRQTEKRRPSRYRQSSKERADGLDRVFKNAQLCKCRDNCAKPPA